VIKTLDGATIRDTQRDPGVYRSTSTRMPKALTKEEALKMLLNVQPSYNDARRFRSPQPFS
jgi:hypothetical protein